MFDAELIMGIENNPQSFVQVRQALHADGFSHQTRHAVAPFVVQAFNHAGFAAAFFAGTVLPCTEEFGIGFIEIGGPLGG